MLRCWVVLCHHSHGTDAWPEFRPLGVEPTQEEIIYHMDDYEGEGRTDGLEPREDEWIEFRGPFEMPEE